MVGCRFGDMATERLEKLKKIARWVGGILSVCANVLPFIPQLESGVATMVRVVWPILLIIFSAVMCWGFSGSKTSRDRGMFWGIIAVTAILLIAWLGWPWPRIHTALADLSSPPLGRVYENEFMSEQEVYWHVADTLRKSGRPVFEFEVRRMIPWSTYYFAEHPERTQAFYRCKDDSLWIVLHDTRLKSEFRISRFTGNTRFSDFCECRIKYLTSSVVRFDWLDFEGRVPASRAGTRR